MRSRVSHEAWLNDHSNRTIYRQWSSLFMCRMNDALSPHHAIADYLSSFLHSSRLFLICCDCCHSSTPLNSLRFKRAYTHSRHPTYLCSVCTHHTHTHTDAHWWVRLLKQCSNNKNHTATHLLLIKTHKLLLLIWFGVSPVDFFFFSLFFLSCVKTSQSDVKRIGSLCIYIRCTISDIVTHSVSRASTENISKLHFVCGTKFLWNSTYFTYSTKKNNNH